MTESNEAVLRSRLLKLFGYPLDDCPTLWSDLGDLDKVGELLLKANADWIGEGWLEHPDVEGWVERPWTEPEPVILARHWCGLLAFGHLSFFHTMGVSGYFVLDLNPRSDGEEAVYYHPHVRMKLRPVSAGRTSHWIYNSIGSYRQSIDDYFALKRASAVAGDSDEDQRNYAARGRDFARDYSRMLPVFASALSKYNVPVVAEPATTNDDDERLNDFEAALLAVANAYAVKLSGGPVEDDTAYSQADAERAEALVSAHGDYPPSLILGMVSPAMAGDMKRARERAQAIIADELGVELTQRWARRIVDGQFG